MTVVRAPGKTQRANDGQSPDGCLFRRWRLGAARPLHSHADRDI
jgi:hypothetical protein